MFIVVLILCEIYVDCFAEGMIKVKYTSVCLNLLHELLDVDQKHSIASLFTSSTIPLFASFCYCCCQSLVCTDVVMSASQNHSYLLCLKKSLGRHCLTKHLNFFFPLFFYSEQLVNTYVCCIPKSIPCPLPQTCSGTLACGQPRLPLLISLIVEGFPLA